MGSACPLAVTATGTVDVQGVELPETASMTIEHEGYISIVAVGHKAMRNTFAGDSARIPRIERPFNVGMRSLRCIRRTTRAGSETE